MTIWSKRSKAEKNFFDIKCIGIASSPIKIKLQIRNPFHIATIYSAYLNEKNSSYFQEVLER